jgi:hypothetical protein
MNEKMNTILDRNHLRGKFDDALIARFLAPQATVSNRAAIRAATGLATWNGILAA